MFWVFGSESVVGTNVMMSMATSTQLNAPTRLLFPRVPSGRISEAATFPYSLLGLGDIAVPGLLACLALRYDASRIVDLRGRAPAALEAIDSAIKCAPFLLPLFAPEPCCHDCNEAVGTQQAAK